jgi:hypothetical protein
MQKLVNTHSVSNERLAELELLASQKLRELFTPNVEELSNKVILDEICNIAENASEVALIAATIGAYLFAKK